MNTEFNFSTPELLILVSKNGDQWTAIGSRKVNPFNLESKLDYYDDEISHLYDFYSVRAPSVREFIVNGSIQNMTMVTGNSPLAAVGALIDALREEEKKELVVEETRKQRAADRERFGGEIDEELIKKIVRWRKKQAKKEAEEFDDGYDEYDY